MFGQLNTYPKQHLGRYLEDCREYTVYMLLCIAMKVHDVSPASGFAIVGQNFCGI